MSSVISTGITMDGQTCDAATNQKGRGVRRTLPAGVFDAAFSSLATFTVGFFAARFLEPVTLGGYALVFSAFLLLTKIPAQFLFKPAEIAVVSFPDHVRLNFLRHTLRLGALPALVAALALSLWITVAPSAVPSDAVLALTVSAVACTFVSPIQDHVRHMLHIGNESWYAATVAAAQFVGAVAGIWLLVRAGVATWWVPFGALTLANVFSLAVGWILVRRYEAAATIPSSLRLKELLPSGRWLVIVALLPTGAAFIASVLVSRLAGPEALGFTEAARVLGQPPFVLSMGLAAVLGPRSIQAARRRQLGTARRISRLYVALMWALGIPYLLLVGFDWEWNPLVHLLPNAYHVAGLVWATVLGNILIGMDWPYRSELLGSGRATSLARIEAAGNAVRAGIAGTAGATGAYAIPAGLVALAAVRSLGYRLALRSLYGDHGGLEPQNTPPAQPAGRNPVLASREAESAT